MSAQAITNLETISGRVEAVNQTGLKLAGRWLNQSRYGRPVELAGIERGAALVATVRDGRWLVELRPASTDEATSLPAPAPTSRSRPGKSPEERREITRLAVLRDAVAFLTAARPDASSADVLELAATFERWVSRPGGE